MSGSFDVAQALDGGVCSRGRAWAFIRSFAAAWGKPLVGVGSLTAELTRAEAPLGCSLPAALHELYALVGTRPDLVGNQDPLLPPHEMFVHDECGGVLVFRSENQGCAFWGVRLADLDREDPPVLVHARHGWVPFMDRLSLASVELVLSEALCGDGGRLYNACELSADLLRKVPEHFQKVPLPDYPMWTGPEDSPVRWFSAPGKLLGQDGLDVHSWLHVRGRTRADLDAICATIPGRWSLGYTDSTSSEPLPF
ncbi:SMI1/KNR4 family protein [Streptomyces longispororuber]|uniref:SMI1/KNR4 family protein n=1 Tax=Streptomyces longispororuber TaxID=68230 RepID=UPI00210B62BB|nr:SMI1/KNR4 family protein [Streptomyces longispororuber]MCQ4205729.1 SMI1/KNR4 family protein [Streptomyces longispororuber]